MLPKDFQRFWPPNLLTFSVPNLDYDINALLLHEISTFLSFIYVFFFILVTILLHAIGMYLINAIHYISFFSSKIQWNHICGVMVSVLASRAVDFGFEPRSGRTKDSKIGISCFSAKHAALRTGLLGIRIMCPSGVTCLSASIIKIQLSVVV